MKRFAAHRVAAVFWKDFLDLRKNRGLLFSLLVLPVVLTLIPIGIVYGYLQNPGDPSLRTMALFYEPSFSGTASAARFMVDKTLADWFGLYLFMPIFVPILISSQSVAGEKERRTLEPLLASPASVAEIVAGKSLASLVPSMAITALAFVLLCVGVDLVSYRFLGELLLPNRMWVFGILVIAPLYAFFGNGVAVLVSARVGDSRLAQQLAGLVVLPILGLVVGQLGGFLRAGPTYYAIQGAVVLVLDLALVVLSIRLFDRERLLTRWS